MIGIYIGSTSGYSGKNMVAMALGLKFQKQGYEVGYMKPVGAAPQPGRNKAGDEDAAFVQGILGLNEEPEVVTPVVFDREYKMFSAKGGGDDLMNQVQKVYQQMSADKEVMIVSGSGSMFSGRYCRMDGVNLVKALGLKALVIDRYYKELNYDFLLVLKDMLEENMLGAIFNGIPVGMREALEASLVPLLQKHGVDIFGSIPQDSLMGSINVDDLCTRLKGTMVSAPSRGDRVVQNFLIGTMQVENFMTHFQKSKNLAVIVGGDRADVQLIALEGQCQCLILTGNIYPNHIIMTRSEVLGIPVVVVRQDTYSVAKKMEEILSRHKLRDLIKIQHGSQLVSSELDINRLQAMLGLEAER